MQCLKDSVHQAKGVTQSSSASDESASLTS